MSDLLFPPSSRPHPGRRLRSQPLYDFCLRSDRPNVALVRQFWNELFSNCRLPDVARRDLKARFTSDSDDEHMGALFELFMYDLLIRTGHRVEFHSQLKKGRPDYRVTAPDDRRYYLEATCALGDEHPKKYDNKLRGVIHDTINGIESDKFMVNYSIRGEFNVSRISKKRLRREVVSLLQATDHGQLLRDQETLEYGQLDKLYGRTIPVGGVSVFIRPIAIDSPRINVQRDLVFFDTDGEMQPVTTDKYLYNSLRNKADQFKKPDLPIVVAVNILEGFLEPDDMMNALFGELHHTAPFGATKPEQIEAHRGPEGLWVHNGRSKNASIAAVWFFAQVGHAVDPVRKPVMVLNPFLDEVRIPQILSFVDYFLPDRSGLSWRNLAPRKSTTEREAWRKDWPLNWISYW